MQAASLYHHFRSKEELLLDAIYIVDRDLIFEQLPLLDSFSSHVECLSRILGNHVLHIGRNRDAWWVASHELRALSSEKLDWVQAYRRRYQDGIARLIADGVRAGEFSSPDPLMATRAILDMINGLNVWFTPDGRYTIEDLADRYVEMSLDIVGVNRFGGGRPI